MSLPRAFAHAAGAVFVVCSFVGICLNDGGRAVCHRGHAMVDHFRDGGARGRAYAALSEALATPEFLPLNARAYRFVVGAPPPGH